MQFGSMSSSDLLDLSQIMFLQMLYLTDRELMCTKISLAYVCSFGYAKNLSEKDSIVNKILPGAFAYVMLVKQIRMHLMRYNRPIT